MKAVLQRVSRARVIVEGEVVSEIGPGLVVLVGVAEGDGKADVDRLAKDVSTLRIFGDDKGRMNRSLVDATAAVLLVSQFTLLADTSKGRRPSFSGAAAPEVAESLVADLGEALSGMGVPVGQGRFGARMEVELVNDGPVTIVLDTRS